ncbi:TauD/TfdA dioxygenase family protein [Novosphingobium album (ex Liu et al. 2023)]|uniref:TauD/TfdA family dioxygenase n=1 Tax=Novosphingobium album (ex Liu et al. 2023) TaxID=3031130 RepID=A0ABT5WQR1_9SPHN|nr:TauD/TfdA family dioxygenase [Novosphingobium album (ex Liu et al. 2023)]MDE8651328.1 TauD/TfdA family dioxygenase [Novosphingobium album (ex Liu et al. 2023)]
MSITVEAAKPRIGGIVHVDKDHLLDDETIETVRHELEQRGVLVFPQINASDELQLAFTDKLGDRVNFTRQVPGSDASSPDVYKITLDRALNSEPDYVLGTFFWHIDGITIDQPLPKATVLSARKLSDSGGATEFANLYAAWDLLPEAEKRALENLTVIHSVEAAVRPVHGHPSEERRARYKAMAAVMEQPLVWTHEDGRKSLLLGTHADGIVGMPGPHGRALLTRLQQWAAQPELVYTHNWTVGDLVIWNNQGVMHRVVPYTDEGRVMHRTTIAGKEKPGHAATEEHIQRIFEIA